MKAINIFILVYIGMALSGCSSLLYYPDHNQYTSERSFKNPAQEIETNIFNETIINWFVPASDSANSKITMIFVHGNGQNMSAHIRSVRWLLAEGVNIFAVEYPGYGPNEGQSDPAKTVESVSKAFEWVKKSRPSDKIVLYGQSLGGNVALTALAQIQLDPQICLVAVEGTFPSYRQVGKYAMSKSKLTWLFQWMPYVVLSDRYSIVNHLNKLSSDYYYLAMHGDNDQVVPFELGERLFSDMPGKKEFWKIEGGGHIDTFQRFPVYRKRFSDLIASRCNHP